MGDASLRQPWTHGRGFGLCFEDEEEESDCREKRESAHH
ncbi:hypothetical protein ACPOL_5887 [Acidisarcina polymorpha]|uniref:Uncharacterized protein n=1 Tax=Acidisarcina polymorpha TaxID=2211140 RepID=A0A2Z5G7U7_9BACT|nr:hypothetical protein ACPOL_5887 [Acidisarcina polymorpha]